MSIGDRLREERISCSLSQKKLSEIAGVGLSSQKNYEKGFTSPDAQYLKSVSSVIDIYYVVTGKRHIYTTQGCEAELEIKNAVRDVSMIMDCELIAKHAFGEERFNSVGSDIKELIIAYQFLNAKAAKNENLLKKIKQNLGIKNDK